MLISIFSPRFYLFVCSICNFGNEFLRRLEINWTDLIHLMLFNLTFYNRPTTHFDLVNVLTPYFMELANNLQLPEYVSSFIEPDHKLLIFDHF